MVRLEILLALFVCVKTEDLLGVKYSFDVDFYNNFNSKKCEDRNMWRLVRYSDLNIEPPDMDSDKGIQAVEDTCASSFPIIFVGGILEIKVYSQEISQMFNLRIEVFDEDNVSVTSYIYHSLTEGFTPGWQTISLKINKHVKGYIHFRGRSLKNEILLIDSFNYTPNDTYNNKRKIRSIDTEKEDEAEIIFKYRSYNDQDENIFESSGDSGNDLPLPPIEQPVEPEERNIWNPFTISIVSFGGVVVLAILVVGAYHYGKVRARENEPLPFVDVEPPRTITIPRVNDRSDRQNPLRFYDF